MAAKVQREPCADSDNYGIILGRNAQNQYVTWEFHLREDDSVFVYWAHYIMEQEKALRDFCARGSDAPQWFDVTVTETLELIVRVEARSRGKLNGLYPEIGKDRSLSLAQRILVVWSLRLNWRMNLGSRPKVNFWESIIHVGHEME